MIEILTTDEIRTLLKTVSRYQIAKKTDISEQTLSNYANGATKIENMAYSRALKLTEFVKEEGIKLS